MLYVWLTGDTVQRPLSAREPPRGVSAVADAVWCALLIACQLRLRRLHRHWSCPRWSQATHFNLLSEFNGKVSWCASYLCWVIQSIHYWSTRAQGVGFFCKYINNYPIGFLLSNVRKKNRLIRVYIQQLHIAQARLTFFSLQTKKHVVVIFLWGLY